MLLVDVNILLLAVNKAVPEHGRARRWWEDRLNGQARVALPWPVLFGFTRIVTNPRVTGGHLPLRIAWERCETWLARKNIWVPAPGPGHARVVGSLLETPGLSSRDVPDAHLAALAMEYGLTLCSHDAGFARFPGLSWEDPIAAPAA